MKIQIGIPRAANFIASVEKQDIKSVKIVGKKLALCLLSMIRRRKNEI